MPQRPLRPCVHKGCRELHRNANSYCDGHQEDAKAWVRPSKSAEARVSGRALQARRLRFWSADPCCVKCARLTDWPSGFELDHIVPLFKGGSDRDSNLQVLCLKCHEAKTADDTGRIGG